MISLAVSSIECRRKYLVPTMKELLNDSSEWVKASAYEVCHIHRCFNLSCHTSPMTVFSRLQSLGKFLTTFANPAIIELGYNTSYDLSIVMATNSESRQAYASNLSLYDKQFNQNASKEMLCSLVYEQKESSITNKIESLATYKNLFSEMLKIDYDFHFPGYNYSGGDEEGNENNNNVASQRTPVDSTKRLDDFVQKTRGSRRRQKCEKVSEPVDENASLEEFNSHQYWYIKPATNVTLDLDAFGVDGNAITAVSQDDDNHSNDTLIYESEYEHI
jgi:hypothetical protein